MAALHPSTQEYLLIKRLAPLAALAALLIIAGCGSTTEISQTSQPVVTTTKTVSVQPPHTRSARSRSAFVGCGGYVQAIAKTTSCDFANNVFYEFYESQPEREFPVYSPATGVVYDISCTGASTVTCSGGEGAKVRFPMSAVDMYTDGNAAAYASTHDLGPDGGDTVAASTPDDSASFCSTHDCIDNFDNGTGYIVQCVDGEWSQSGGRPGACSYHGGETGRTYP
jgi:hypothetical protein